MICHDQRKRSPLIVRANLEEITNGASLPRIATGCGRVIASHETYHHNILRAGDLLDRARQCPNGHFLIAGSSLYRALDPGTTFAPMKTL